MLRITRIFAAELLGSLAIVPYGKLLHAHGVDLQWPRLRAQGHTSWSSCAQSLLDCSFSPRFSNSSPCSTTTCMAQYPNTLCMKSTTHSTGQLTEAVLTGVRAMRIHGSLPQNKHSLHAPLISICKDVAYGNRPRTIMDIYVPSQQAAPSQPSHPESSWQNRPDTDSANRSMGDSAAADSKTSDSAQEQFPVALFCHGGVWATGAPPPKSLVLLVM